ncbi:MAG: hypothetical protein LBL39_01070, partial [Planctomycetaceae bacterium]|jgi:hypothetical protein|nr:hypothetical protein [Planctomycetaceae bacterium]
LIDKWLAKGRVEGRVEGHLEGHLEGLNEGLNKGLNEGLVKGHAESEAKWHADRVERAGELRRRGFDDETIVVATGLSLNEVKHLKSSAQGKVSRKKSMV